VTFRLDKKNLHLAKMASNNSNIRKCYQLLHGKKFYWKI